MMSGYHINELIRRGWGARSLLLWGPRSGATGNKAIFQLFKLYRMYIVASTKDANMKGSEALITRRCASL